MSQCLISVPTCCRNIREVKEIDYWPTWLHGYWTKKKKRKKKQVVICFFCWCRLTFTWMWKWFCAIIPSGCSSRDPSSDSSNPVIKYIMLNIIYSLPFSLPSWHFLELMPVFIYLSPQWSLVCGSASEVHIAKFSLLVGSIFGYLVFGILADWWDIYCQVQSHLLQRQMCFSKYNLTFISLRFGRHPVLIISVFFMLVFGLTVAFSVNVAMFSTLRFFEGFCLAGITLSLYVLSKSGA